MHLALIMHKTPCPNCGNLVDVWYTSGWPYGKNKIIVCLNFCNTKFSEPCPEDEEHLIGGDDDE